MFYSNEKFYSIFLSTLKRLKFDMNQENKNHLPQHLYSITYRVKINFSTVCCYFNLFQSTHPFLYIFYDRKDRSIEKSENTIFTKMKKMGKNSIDKIRHSSNFIYVYLNIESLIFILDLNALFI